MAEKLLDSLFKGNIELETITNWIIFDGVEIESFQCSRGELISYFLNTLHEEAPCNEVTETPHKKKPTDIQTPATRKRQSLFQNEIKPQISKSQTFPPLNSTPKLIKIPSELSVYQSPISPLYCNNESFSTTPTPKLRDKNKNAVCLGDFIVQTRKSTGKKKKTCDETKKSRRINPTCLNEKKTNINFAQCENSFDFERDVKEIAVEDARNFLVEECMRIGSRGVVGTPQKKISFFVEKNENEIFADLKSVTQRANLDILICLYTVILRNNLALNLSSELYFIVSLLFRKCFNKNFDGNEGGITILNTSDANLEKILTKKPSDCVTLSHIFTSTHNIIYFAIKTIENLVDLFEIFDKATIKLLAEHKYVCSFSAHLSAQLNAIYRNKTEKPRQEIFNGNNSEVNVCFISDTDNRENFPNDQSFSAFRKQRDLFYEILRIWEKNHLTSGWSFNMALGGKIRALLALHHEGVNYMHLARLFKNQLLSTYGKQHLEESVSEEQLSFLSSILNVNIDKVNRLKSRLVTKQSPNSINPTPDFTGLQEFYRDFLLIASTHIFIQHIKDVFVAEILQLNDTNFSSNEFENDRNTVDVPTQKSFLCCIKSLRILAKFLGFLDALPYRLDSIPSEGVVTTQIKIREKSQPTFELILLLSNAISKKTLVLTIPWLTKYLSMLDYVTLRLPHYISLFKKLFYIYRKIRIDRNNFESVMLIKFCLGWLFELPNVPGSLYYNFEDTSELFTLDELRLVDQHVLAVCCPYLKEIKKLLLSNTATNDGVTVKHITPLTAVQSPAKIAKKRLEIQLEEAFFSGQPISVKKTVEFVSERIASTCVKHICSSVVPTFKKQASEGWREVLEANKPITESSRLHLKRKSHEFASDCLKRLLHTCRDEIQKIVKEKTNASIEALLALDVLSQTKQACTSIASRLCVERTEEWICSHVVMGIFTKDFECEINRYINNTMKKPKEKSVFALPLGGRDVRHNKDTCSAVQLVECIREMSLNVIEEPACVDITKIMNLLNTAIITINERCDVNDNILNNINVILVDLFLLLIAHQTAIALQENVQKAFVQIWKTYSGDSDNLFKTLICPRNVMLLAQSNDVTKSWDTFATFSAFLLKEKLMTCECFEAQSVGIFKHDWDANSLKNLTDCFTAFLKYYSNSNENCNKFTLLIGFLSEFCCDID